MKARLRNFIALVGLVGNLGCASQQPYMMPENQDENLAGAGMTFRKAMPDRRNPKPWQFYYKHCDATGEEVYFSKTSYDCNGPTY